MKKHVLGLDIGTNSIGWALIAITKSEDADNKYRIKALGSHIIPMSQDEIGNFNKGVLQSEAAERTKWRIIRRRGHRQILRRERLHRLLHTLDFLPEHYASEIDFNNRPGQFLPEAEPKIAYRIDKNNKKAEFIYKEAFNEMLSDFAINQPGLVAENKKIPYDWTIYYLRKKALTEKISKEELAWVILSFNQKRGYFELRGEEEEPDKTKAYCRLTVTSVVDKQEKNKKGMKLFAITFDNGWEYEYAGRELPDWEGKQKEYIVTTTYTKNGTERRSFSIPKEDDWTLIKAKTTQEIEASHQTVGEYIYNALLAKPDQKIRGKLIQTIERKFYRKELDKILRKQSEFHPELTSADMFKACLMELYPHNDAHRHFLEKRDMVYLLKEDTIFYQRPLKSQKTNIDNCPYEKRGYTQNGEAMAKPIKCLSRSHPLFEEFRLWQFLNNVRITRLSDTKDVTKEIVKTQEDVVELFDKLRDKKEVNRKSFLALLKGKYKETEYDWNYGDRVFPLCPTRAEIVKRLKGANIDKEVLTDEMEDRLWHILYSVTAKDESEKALKKFAEKQAFSNPDAFAASFLKVPPFKSEYAAYSAKAIRKLLAVMRMGKYWSAEKIDNKTQERIQKIIDGEFCDTISEKTRENVRKLLGEQLSIESFSGLPTHLACYVVYNRHSETTSNDKWNSPNDIDQFIADFKQHSLRNPVVEKITKETLRVVRDLWQKYGDISEIHVELGREMKLPNDKRRRATERNEENEKTNMRIRAILAELKSGGVDVRPESPAAQDKMRLYEEGALGKEGAIPEDIYKISKQANPSKTDIIKYKCWLEQGYLSPYTGQIIPLSQLFTSKYEVEHIIPRARYFDDSFNNKVICEAAVNRDKKDLLAYEYICKNGEQHKIDVGGGRLIPLLSAEKYEEFVRRNYRNNPFKRRNLLLDEIPASFISRQLNDTRYISRYIMSLLSNIVREENEQEATPKNILTVNGSITTRLKTDWGLNDVWNKIVTPRFERLNDNTQSNDYGYWQTPHHFIATVPEKEQQGFSKKRIDHRHHAMDALAIACATRAHIQYMNNESASPKDASKRLALRNSLCEKDDEKSWRFSKPWPTFTEEAREAIENIIVSFKQSVRVLGETQNYYTKYENGKKVSIRQIKGDLRAIRKPLHKETYYGKVNIKTGNKVKLAKAIEMPEAIVNLKLREKIEELYNNKMIPKEITAYFKKTKNQFCGQDISEVEVFDIRVASRSAISPDIKIEKVVDESTRSILLSHLAHYNGDKQAAFSSEGIEHMNKNIVALNGGRKHKPIYKVRISDALGEKFVVGQRGNKKTKYVEAQKGTNLYFAIYQDENKNRSYCTIPLNTVIENLKNGFDVADPFNESGKLLFTLSPNDLVYVPTEEQLERGSIEKEDILEHKDRIYKMVSASKKQCFFVPYYMAYPISQTTELGANNKAERAWSGEMISKTCIKIAINLLGEIIDIKQ